MPGLVLGHGGDRDESDPGMALEEPGSDWGVKGQGQYDRFLGLFR